MKLYVGGLCQGQNELARAENPEAELFTDFENAFRDVEDAPAFARAFCDAHPDAVIAANEIGSGIVPINPAERAWREAAGRGLCVIAQRADQVIRAVCGIGVRIK